MKPNKSNFTLAILASLTLGLAPFTPEPHIWGKIQWIAGGANGMKLIDWWDTVMHGAPFVYLGLLSIFWVLKQVKIKHFSIK